ncbi:flavin-containing monooxygenase [Occultella gossypii]|uniref:NAD(P)-binding domain-containing protein n=1 Tax=Occultella gossypii TaxID=2800820 RepID=A0ABS7SG05_9MICO|nr:NAD(P)-binding domain-containing protein [Occultella gossypii]MBZ2198655.1 NAD(P)-binding domain-containing protein [Occultella gossypii]
MSTHHTIVIGGGQSGLSAGYHLAQAGVDFVILDAEDHVGAHWEGHWDSLRLFSPARYSSLPGLDVPGDPRHFPDRDEIAGYLRTYAEHFALPVRSGVRVDSLRRVGETYVAEAGDQRFEAPNVVVATGPHQEPYVPDFAAELDPGIRQWHSTGYRGPSDLPAGDVLVVGASHSGADIAYETAATHATTLAGAVNGQMPFRIEGPEARVILPIWFFATRHLLTMRTPVGRRLRVEVRTHGAPLVRVRTADLAAAGVRRTGRVTGVTDGLPVADGTPLDVASVIWCTGYRQNYSWIDLPVTDEAGFPISDRGVTSFPGLYFLGVPFQYAFASMLIGGAGRDAGYVARHLLRAREPVAAA